MNPLILFLLGAIPSFAVGAWARPYMDRIIEEGRDHMPHSVRRTRRARVAGFLGNPPQKVVAAVLAAVAVVACAALIYTVQEQDRREEGDTYLIDCLSALLEESSVVSQVRAEAMAERDAALRETVKANARLARELEPSKAEVKRANQALEEFEEASARLDVVQSFRPIPTFTEYCDAKLVPTPGPSGRTPEPSTPSPTGRVDDDAAVPGQSNQKKAERKGRRSPPKDPPSSGGGRPPTPSPTQPPGGPLLPLPDLLGELLDELPDLPSVVGSR